MYETKSNPHFYLEEQPLRQGLNVLPFQTSPAEWPHCSSQTPQRHTPPVPHRDQPPQSHPRNAQQGKPARPPAPNVPFVATVPPPVEPPRQPFHPQVQSSASVWSLPVGGLLIPQPRPTKPLMWLIAIFCAVLWVLVFLAGLIILIVYLMFRPKSPWFDISNASLNAAYVDVGDHLNADFTLLVNFTNPNDKVTVDFSYIVLNLYHGNTLIATHSVFPFTAARFQTRIGNVHMVSSQVRLHHDSSQQLKKQIERNQVVFTIKSAFRVRPNLGSFLGYSYWLYGKCTIVLTRPPRGILLGRKCVTKH